MSVISNKTFNATNPEYNACVGNNGFVDLGTYSYGYKEAVEILIQKTLAHQTTLDAIVYPMVYCARHYLELSLKKIIESISKINFVYDGHFIPPDVKSHSVFYLWGEVKRISAVDERYEKGINSLEEYINDYPGIDDSAETFRYPVDHDGNKHLVGQHCINLLDFSIRFAEMSSKIDDFEALCDSLECEYRLNTTVDCLSRNQIRKIAKELPNEPWSKATIMEPKQKIMTKFGIGSRTFSKVVQKIRTHHEFYSMIGGEIALPELSVSELKFFWREYDVVRRDPNFSLPKEYWQYAKVISQKISKKAIAALAQLYDLGYFWYLYCEDYLDGFNTKMKKNKVELVGDYLIANGIVKEKIVLGLKKMGQRTLLASIGYTL